jgi:hypothetical protein
MRVLAMQQPLAAQQILGKIFECINRKKRVDLAVFSYYFTNFCNMSWIWNGGKVGFISEIEL